MNKRDREMGAKPNTGNLAHTNTGRASRPAITQRRGQLNRIPEAQRIQAAIDYRRAQLEKDLQAWKATREANQSKGGAN